MYHHQLVPIQYLRYLSSLTTSLQINDHGLDHVENIVDASKLLNSGSILSLTLAKSCNTINSLMGVGGPLSSSSSGHNMQENESETQGQQSSQQHAAKSSSKSLSATTSPIKDTIRGSQEMIKKLMSSKDRHSGGGDRPALSSSSSEKVYSVNNSVGSKSAKDSSKKLIDTVKEKFGKRRSSKEPLEIASDHDVIESDKGPDMAIAELDSVINSYHVATAKSSGNGKRPLLSYITLVKSNFVHFAFIACSAKNCS